MESGDLWKAHLSGSSLWRYKSQSAAELYQHEEIDGDDELKTEYPCLFCADEFDLVGFCCHIDEEHLMEAKTEVCPLCVKRVGADLVSVGLLFNIILNACLLSRTVQQPPLSQKEQEETAQKCEFVRGLLFSTILDDF
ncbi:hypothetical protein UlMin_020348 [Ulmus minor]